MSNIEQSFLFASLENIEDQGEVEVWPLHVTLVPWFGIDQERTDLLDKTIQGIAVEYRPFEILGGEEAFFGTRNDLRVRKISSPVLRTIRHDLCAAVRAFGGEIDSTYAFDPHASYKGQRGLKRDQAVRITALQRGVRRDGLKSIEAVYGLGVR